MKVYELMHLLATCPASADVRVSKARGLVPLADGAVFALCALVDLIGRGDVQKVTVVVPAICTVRIAISGNKITVDRVEGKKVSGVAGEN